VKRSSTEITRQRTLETERKKSLGLSTEKVAEAQRTVDDLERKRQEALDILMRLQDDQTAVLHSLREAQSATESALAAIRKEQKAKQDAESEMMRDRASRSEAERVLRRSLLKALDIYLEQQAGAVGAAFSTQEQRSKAQREFEAFRRARYTDPEIGRLCDERDEIQKLLGTVMVPGVKTMLEESLRGIEESLVKRFPTALRVPDAISSGNQIEELMFYRDREGKALILLPVRPVDWGALEANTASEAATKWMCLLWSMITELKLRTEDGDFLTAQGRPVFASKFDLEEVAILQGFPIKREGTDVIHFVLTAVPAELQEVLSHEDQDH